MKKKDRPYIMRPHEREPVFDEIRLIGVEGEWVVVMSLLPRYKTSGLSGDEWRFSVGWSQAITGATPAPFDTGYGGVEAACAALYPGLYQSHKDWHTIQIAHVDFLSKGHILYRGSHDGDHLPLIVTAGHLPWALIIAEEQRRVLSTDEEWKHCCQPGCASHPDVYYQLKELFTRRGDATPAVYSWPGPNKTTKTRPYGRHFCARHAIRGDCGLEDADRNYEKISGGTPEPIASDESPSVFGGVISVTIGDE